jgi:hypothetical protein
MVPAKARPLARLAALATGAALTAAMLISAPVGATTGTSGLASTNDPSCQLRNGIQHVIYLQFDNVHLTRDNPNVPSDLEQMPNLLHFLEANGTLLTHEHTPLIAHTATDILTSLTGVYGNDMGVPIANSFRYFTPTGTSSVGVSFAYWTSPIYDPTTSSPTDTTYNMLTAQGQNAPAPWVPYTRAGCDVGSVATANTILENTSIDIPTVFGANSPQAAEVTSNPAQAFADFVGIGVHCAQSSSLCTNANGGEPDLLPQEPGGYSGYQALFGAKYVDPQIYAGGTPVDLTGATISDGNGHVGFPGFDGMSASVSLSYVAAMQEHGVPVTYAYISDAHDAHPNGPAYGPGEAGYVAALKSYDDAFGTFINRLAGDGITPANTLFVVTADEGDHFAGGQPSNTGCDGVNTACQYSHVNCPSATLTSCPSDAVGEINGNLAGLLATQQNNTTPFKVHSDSAPNFYVTGNPGPTDAVTRALERAAGALTATNLYSGQQELIGNYLADPVEEQILHMVTADPYRTPTFTMFARPDYYLYAGAPDCTTTYACLQVEYGFAWNHGTVAPEINTTFLGLVGPGVRHFGLDGSVWSDHTDIRPTMMALTGLTDDYSHDGRVLWEVLYGGAVPQAARAHTETLTRLAEAYKQLDADVGQFGLATLAVSTDALTSNAANDATYTELESWLSTIGAQRDALASQIQSMLEGAEFHGQAVNNQAAKAATAAAWALISQAQSKAANP